MKTCAKCLDSLSVDNFWPDKKAKDGLKSWCKSCSVEYNRPKPRPCVQCGNTLEFGKNKFCNSCAPGKRWMYTINKYGVDKVMWDAMYFEQDGKCAMVHCVHEAEHVDHCHKTGKVRSLLCIRCNTDLGPLENDIFLTSAALYWEEHK